TFSPRPVMIQPVAVLPRLAPMTPPIACVKEISPALRKPIRVTVVAVEDWASAVIKAPDAKALMGLPVKASRICLRTPPAKATSPSDSSIMPIRNRPSPPTKGKRVSSIKECEQRNKRQIPAGKVGAESWKLHYRQLRCLWSEILECCKQDIYGSACCKCSTSLFFCV